METREREEERHWYVIHTYSGYENKVKVNLEKKIESQNLQDEIFSVVVPMEDEIEDLPDGKTKTVKRKIFPGYVMVDMIVNDRSWYVVRNTQGVTGFVGTEKDPIPLSEEEASRILGKADKPVRVAGRFSVGDSVKVVDGWLLDREGEVLEVNEEEKRLMVLIDGTNVDLEFGAVKKI